MKDEDKTNDESKRTRKDKKIIDVLMDDGEWSKRKKFRKKKKEQEPEHQPKPKPEPEPEDKTEPKPETEPEKEAKPEPESQPEDKNGPEKPEKPERPEPDPLQPQREPSSASEDKTGGGEEEQPEVKPEAKSEEKMRVPESEKSAAYLSEIERNVLRAIVMGDSNVNDIIRSTNYPEVIVKGAIERLVSKDFIDRNLNPTEKIRDASLKRQGPGFTVGRKRRYRLGIIDVAIIVAVILFLVSLLYYMGLLG